MLVALYFALISYLVAYTLIEDRWVFLLFVLLGNIFFSVADYSYGKLIERIKKLEKGKQEGNEK